MKIVGLPFPVTIAGDTTCAGPATLRLDLKGPLDEEAFDQLRCVVPWFAELAQQGAYGGTRIAPTQVAAVLASAEPDARSLHPSWSLDKLAIDSTAVTSLANLVYATGHELRAFTLTCTGADITQDLAFDQYPDRARSLPFSLEEDITERTVELIIDFSSDLPEQLVEPLCDLLRTWSMVAALGGFREAGPLPHKLGLVPEDDPRVTLDQLSFIFRDSGVNIGAYDALVSMLAAFSLREHPISRVGLH